MSEFLFVAGCARSGTSALAMKLNQHPEISIGMERYINALFRSGELHPNLFEKNRFFNIEEGDTFYKGLCDLRGNPTEQEYDEARYHGDKIPRLFLYYDKLFRNFPAAKVLFIVRNPMSVAASFKARSQDHDDANWHRSRDARASVKDWNESLASSLPYIRTGRILPLAYERLFIDGLGWESIRNFLRLSIPFKEACQNDGEFKLTNLSGAELDYVRLNANWSSYNDVLGHVFGGSDRDIYSHTDKELIDYSPRRTPGLSIAVRDPSQRDTICLGSAATFGRFVSNPYPMQLNAANFGIGGARPETFLYEPLVLSRLAEAKTAVIEVTSARGYGGAVFSPLNRFTNMVTLSRASRKSEFFEGLPERIFIDRIWDRLIARDPDRAMEMIECAQAKWVKEMKDLLRFVRRPILFWFSQHEPAAQIVTRKDYRFPHFVTEEMLTRIDSEVVKLVSSRGIPYKLNNKFGEPMALMEGWTDPTVNSYYPSQEMHDDAATLLSKVI